MKKKVKDKWVAALRSRKYSQSLHYLKEDNYAYSCLGVLCALYLIEHGNIIWEEAYNKIGIKYYTLGGCGEYLPKIVQDWAGLTTDSPSVVCSNDKLFLPKPKRYSLNYVDGVIRKSFEQIADIIEEQL